MPWAGSIAGEVAGLRFHFETSKRGHGDVQFKVVFDAIRELMLPPAPPKRQIGFHVREEAARGYRVRRHK